MNVPGETGQSTEGQGDDSIYELAPVAPIPAVPIVETVFSEPGDPDGTTVLPYQHGSDESPVDYDPQFAKPIRDLWMPVVSIALAFCLGLAVGLRWSDLPSTLVAISCYAVMKGVIMLICIPFMVRFAGVSFGRTESAVLKLAAIALLPDALAISTLNFVPTCFALPLMVLLYVSVTWFMLKALFDLDWSETNGCIIVLMVCTVVPSALWYQLFEKTWNLAQ